MTNAGGVARPRRPEGLVAAGQRLLVGGAEGGTAFVAEQNGEEEGGVSRAGFGGGLDGDGALDGEAAGQRVGVSGRAEREEFGRCGGERRVDADQRVSGAVEEDGGPVLARATVERGPSTFAADQAQAAAGVCEEGEAVVAK